MEVLDVIVAALYTSVISPADGHPHGTYLLSSRLGTRESVQGILQLLVSCNLVCSKVLHNLLGQVSTQLLHLFLCQSLLRRLRAGKQILQIVDEVNDVGDRLFECRLVEQRPLCFLPDGRLFRAGEGELAYFLAQVRRLLII